MDIFSFDPSTFLSFLLTLIRLSLIVFLLPFFGGENVPAPVKASLCIILTFSLWPNLSLSGDLMPASGAGIIALVASEAFMGMVLGLFINFIFAGIQVGGEILSMQMGFTSVSMIDPMSGARISLTSNLLYMVALVIFLIFDGHLYMLKALAMSFKIVPPGGFTPHILLTNDILELSANMFVLAIKIASPLIASLLATELTLALMGRAAPQMNLLTLGFPLKISVGFFMISLLFVILGNYMEEVILFIEPWFTKIMKDGVSGSL